MKLTELLNKKVPFEVIEDEEYVFSTRAKIGDRFIIFYAGFDDDGWDVQFTEAKSDRPMAPSTFKLTGSGNELEVFAMIKDSIKAFVAKHNPDVIRFTASKDGTKRADVYEKLLKRFIPSGYEYKRTDEPEHGYNPHDAFIMTKKK